MYGHLMSREPGTERSEPTPTDVAPESSASGRPATEMLDMSRGECLRQLAANSFGRLAVNIGEGAPVIRPISYVFDEPSQSVAFRTAAGSKFDALVRASDAAFEIDGIDEASRTGWSVIVRGVTGEVRSPSERRRLDSLGLEPWAPGHRAHWVQIRAWTVSGRRIVLAAGEVRD